MALYHGSRLGPNTKAAIHNIINNSAFTYSRHASERRIHKGIADWQYIAEHGEVIELNHSPSDGRDKALLRTPDGHCAVFGLNTKMIVTCYWNDPSDTHKTLDTSKYVGGVAANWV